MNRKILLAVILLVLTSLACGLQLAEWEMTSGTITLPVDDLTLYVCHGRGRSALRQRQGFVDVIPKGTKVIDSGRRHGPLGNQAAELYYGGESISVLISSLGICEETEVEQETAP